REDAGDATGDGLAAVVGPERGARCGLAVVLEAPEEKQAVSNDRSAEGGADVVILERARIERVRARVGADEAVVALIVIERAADIVGAALRDHVDAGAHEIALTHVV